MRTYEEHLDAWALLDELGYDGRRLQRTSYVAVRVVELAELDGRGRGAAARSREHYRDMTMAEHAGAGTVQLSFNRGAMPHEQFVEQIRRFARDVLPALQAHEITMVPLAAEAVA